MWTAQFPPALVQSEKLIYQWRDLYQKSLFYIDSPFIYSIIQIIHFRKIQIYLPEMTTTEKIITMSLIDGYLKTHGYPHSGFWAHQEISPLIRHSQQTT